MFFETTSDGLSPQKQAPDVSSRSSKALASVFSDASD